MRSFSKRRERWDPRIGSRAELRVGKKIHKSSVFLKIGLLFDLLFNLSYVVAAHLSMYGMFVGMPTLN